MAIVAAAVQRSADCLSFNNICNYRYLVLELFFIILEQCYEACSEEYYFVYSFDFKPIVLIRKFQKVVFLFNSLRINIASKNTFTHNTVRYCIQEYPDFSQTGI